MKVNEAMTRQVDTIGAGSRVSDAARHMKQLNIGFLPVSDAKQQKLIGVATDRDIVLRCIANDLDPGQTPVEEVISDKVLYCFADDDMESAAKSMAEQQVYRLVVLDSPESKQLAGIVTLGDIRRHGGGASVEWASDQIAGAG